MDIKESRLEALLTQAIQKQGKTMVCTLLQVLLLDTSPFDQLFHAACKLQAKHHRISQKELLKSKKAEIVLTRHLMIYTLYQDQGWASATLKRLFGIQRSEWLYSIIESTKSRIEMNYLDVPKEYERIAASIEALSQAFQQH